MTGTVEPVLSVDGLRIEFGGRSVVEDLSFSVDAGETVAVVGECTGELSAGNGSGGEGDGGGG